MTELQTKHDSLTQVHQSSQENLAKLQAVNEVLVSSNDELQSKVKEAGVENGKLETAR